MCVVLSLLPLVLFTAVEISANKIRRDTAEKFKRVESLWRFYDGAISDGDNASFSSVDGAVFVLVVFFL